MSARVELGQHMQSFGDIDALGHGFRELGYCHGMRGVVDESGAGVTQRFVVAVDDHPTPVCLPNEAVGQEVPPKIHGP